MNEVIQTGGFSIELRRSARRRTLGLTVDRGGALIAHAPAAVPHEEILDWIQSRLLWVHQKLGDKEAMQPLPGTLEFVSGESIFFLGKACRLKIESDARSGLEFDGSRFILSKNVSDPEQIFRKWFIRSGQEVIRKRVASYQRRIRAKPLGMRVCDLGYRWGSCSAKKQLNFNWRLFQLPLRLVDYVVAHEMTHLLVPDHSSAFWSTLAAIQPDCLARRVEIDREAMRYLRFAMPHS